MTARHSMNRTPIRHLKIEPAAGERRRGGQLRPHGGILSRQPGTSRKGRHQQGTRPGAHERPPQAHPLLREDRLLQVRVKFEPVGSDGDSALVVAGICVVTGAGQVGFIELSG